MDILSGKRLLLLGAGRGNLGMIKTAKRHGVFVVLTGTSGNYPCNPYADKICFADISDPEAVLEVAQNERVDGIIICCSDLGLRAVGRCNDILRLTGLSEKAALVSSDKLLMKQKLIDAGVRTAKFFKVKDLESLNEAIKELGFPIVIKATDLQGSQGISIVKDESTLVSAFQNTMLLTRKEYCIVESYIKGKEFGAQAFVYQGDILFILPHGDETVMCRTAVPIGHYMPYEMSPSLYKDTCLQVTKSIHALGLDNCAINVDLIEKGEKAFIIELTGRVGANCLPELTGHYFGIDYYEMILSTALGESPLPCFEKRRDPISTVSKIIKSESSGICRSISVPRTQKRIDIQMFIQPGSVIRSFNNSNDAIGQVIAYDTSREECERAISDVIKKIVVEYE